ncbi:ATP-binding protein [Amycolatopsis sp. H20-H5]|uniref:ATP-binding protein n=1 Tax=Amycolatopsis sp. H20-H5 TaxID=3046309 RepID=UPI002DB95848|nr:ATP-binding protein [Amycolatopsis sp. H20-H5]MEC3977923.1 ATP-binding protein [Amycolatopsis sp. H20-H5]
MGSEEVLRELATDLQRIIRATAETVGSGQTSELVDKVTDWLGVPLSQVVVVGRQWESWEHANLQRGVDAYLAERGTGPEWFGLVGGHRGNEELVSMLASARRHGMYELGAVDFATAAIGPDEATEVVQLGLITTKAPDGTRVVIGVRGANPQFGQAMCRVEVLSVARETATVVRDRVEHLMSVHDVFRGQVLAFGTSENRGNELLTFLPRPKLADEDVVLPDGVLDAIERHTVSIASHGERLLAAGQHLKRGLLLHGPPGTGKTHTVRYLMGRLPGSTVIVLTGLAMRYITKAAELARRLQPSLVVLEDVDLIAQDRSHTPMGNPLLFTLLDAMDGVGHDADVTFLLTTNRAEELERALADRPGRVDLAIEIPKPDAEGRLKLLRLYGRGVDLTADLGPVVEQSEGVTASFVKELLRRAALRSIVEDPDRTPVTVGDRELTAALSEMNEAHNALTRSLLGNGSGA